MEPLEEVEPIEGVEPIEEVEPTEEEEPIGEVEPLEEVEPTEEVEPIEEVEPTEEVEPMPRKAKTCPDFPSRFPPARESGKVSVSLEHSCCQEHGLGGGERGTGGE